MHVGVGMVDQPAQIGFASLVVLPARDAFLHVGVETLDADFELQHAGRKLRDQFLQAIRQMIGNDLEVQKQIVGQTIEEKLQDGQRGVDFEIEGPVYEFEIARAALVERFHFAKKGRELEGLGRFVERAQAELAFERAAARSFDI